MRNLKRALSLALASVMVIGMMVVGTGAESYKDVTSEHNEEAIAVLQAAGVMVGDNGNFNPDQQVTRNEMAVVMSKLLKLDYNYYVGAQSPFTDVPSWAAPYVSACYANGIVSGTSATTYGGEGNVTAAQASLMIMKALGYFQHKGDFNQDWQLATVKQASKINLYNGINANAATPLTRNQIAQLVLNGLQADMVEFNGDVGTDITTSDGTVITVGHRPQYDAYTSVKGDYTNAAADNAVGVKPANDGALQLIEELFGADLQKKTAGQSDDFGRPANNWTYTQKGVITDLGTYDVEPTLTYTKGVSEKDLYNALGLKEASNTKSITKLIDGVGGAYALAKATTTDLPGTGNGALTEVYVDNAGAVTVTVMNTYIGEVVAVNKATKDNARSITVAGLNATAGRFETEDFDVDDVVLYTHSKLASKVESVALAQKVTGKMSAYATGKSVTVDGQTYEYNTTKNDVADGSKVDIDVEVYVDQYGYAMDVRGVNTDVQYAYVLNFSEKGGVYGGETLAQLLLADGTIVDVKVGTEDLAATDKELLVGYTISSTGKYNLTKTGISNKAIATGATTVTNGNNTVALDGATTTTANGETVFLVITGTTADPVYKSYTGIANVPTITKASGLAYDYYEETSGLATIVVLDARGAAVSSTDAEIVYIAGDDSAKITDADGSYYVYNAVVGGKSTTVKVDAAVAEAVATKLTDGTDRAFASANYNDAGIIISFGSAAKFGTGTQKQVNDVIGLDDNGTMTWYGYAKDCVVFFNDGKNNLTESSISAITNDSTNPVQFVLKDNKVVAVFITEAVSNGNDLTVDGIDVDGSDISATIAGWGAETGVDLANAKTMSITETGVTGDKEITINLTADPMATVTVLDNTLAAKTNAASSGSVTGVVTYCVEAEDGTACYYKLTVTLTTA